ncbi:hypothetical protein Pelo_19704 [Pelomyxa schiedti]|nr:hypothetical protein Pelo_19704 [Pelomyxa schiedti]
MPVRPRVADQVAVHVHPRPVAVPAHPRGHVVRVAGLEGEVEEEAALRRRDVVGPHAAQEGGPQPRVVARLRRRRRAEGGAGAASGVRCQHQGNKSGLDRGDDGGWARGCQGVSAGVITHLVQYCSSKGLVCLI